MSEYKKAVACVNKVMAEKEKERRKVWTLEEFMQILDRDPGAIRNVHSLFRDMVLKNCIKIPQRNPDDADSINYTGYDCTKLLADGQKQAFYASILFSHMFVNGMKKLGTSGQQNKIYKITGPPGSGKSTFKDNLLLSFCRETEKKPRYETIWVLEEELVEEIRKKVYHLPTSDCDCSGSGKDKDKEKEKPKISKLVMPCPSHCNPLQSIPDDEPGKYRTVFFDQGVTNKKLKDKVFNSSEFAWMWKRSCHICKSIFWTLYDIFEGDVAKVLSCLQVRRYLVDRQISKGISVFRSGDEPSRFGIQTNEKLQGHIDEVFGNSNSIKYVYSAKAVNDDGIVFLEDVKDHNLERLKKLHGEVSEGICKFGDIVEEDLDCLYFVVINPEDEKVIDSLSLTDRITELYIPYATDVPTEVSIYRDVFGKDFEKKYNFMPELAKYFAKVVLVSRMPEIKNKNGDFTEAAKTLYEWISAAEIRSHYEDYCDKEGLLLMMAIAKAKLPPWIKEEHKKNFKQKIRRHIIEAMEKMAGRKGYTGRDSNDLMSDFLDKMDEEIQKSKSKEAEYIPGFDDMLSHFKTQPKEKRDRMIPQGFLDQLEHTYDSKQLELVKAAMYSFSPEDIAKDVKNYIYAVSQQNQIGSKVKCKWTGDEIDLTDEFFAQMEKKLHDTYPDPNNDQRKTFRNRISREYTQSTLACEMNLHGRPIQETDLYSRLYKAYAGNLKDRVLTPYVGSDSFRRAVVDYGAPEFDTGYDKRTVGVIEFLLTNLQKEEYGSHTLAQAKKAVLRVLDKEREK